MTPLERNARFDELARLVSEGIPRRQALRRIGGFMAALALSGPAEALGAKRKKKCPKGHVLCGTRCCPSGYSCHTHKGKKTCTCASPKKVCSGSCIDPRSDVHHCGSCSKKCKSGQTCAKGKCVTHKQSDQGDTGPGQQQQPTPTCSDGVKNGNETDVDCGGPTCPKCANGRSCVTGTDCVSGVCTNTVCVAPGPGCSGDACGGPSCPPCANGRACAAGTDCTSGHCLNRVCAACEADANCAAAGAGTCQRAVCAAGVCGFAADDTNLPAGSGCAAGTCAAGVPGSAPAPATTVCGANRICDGAGHCVDCVPNGGGGCALCVLPNDCPIRPHALCVDKWCISGGALAVGVCGYLPDPEQTPCGNSEMCDGAGNCVQCVTAANCGSPGPCVAATCIDSICGTMIRPAGASCPPGICDGAGNCYTPCTTDSQCDTPGSPGSCVDGFCCDSTCNSPCTACSQARTGMPNGVCAQLPTGATCGPSMTCNQFGFCV